MKRLAYLSLFAWVVLGIYALFQTDAVRQDFERFLSYPFVDRAERAAARGDWEETETLTRELLNRVPDNEQARLQLVQALSEQGRHGEAVEAAAGLSDARVLRQELRLSWINRERPPSPEIVSAWLQDSSEPERQALWRAYSFRLQQLEGAAAALTWLNQQAPGNVPGYRQWQAALAEQAGDRQAVISALEPLLDTPDLRPEDWRRLSSAYVGDLNVAGIERLLASTPDAFNDQILRRMAAARAIALESPGQALSWLRPLQANGSLEAEELPVLWELARQSNDYPLVRSLGDTLGRPCHETTEWLSQRDQDQALAALATCNPAQDPQRHLELSIRLGAWEQLAATVLPEPAETRRQQQLVNYWRSQGRADTALNWLETLPLTRSTARLRAELLQELGGPGLTEAWLSDYRLSGDPLALDQATFLLVNAGNDEQAHDLLRLEFQARPERMNPNTRLRLADLMARRSAAPTPDLASSLLSVLEREQRSELLLRLAREGQCSLVDAHIPAEGRSAREFLALAQCAQTSRPGLAVSYHQSALALEPTLDARPLAYAFYAAGDAASALVTWLQADPTSLARDDLLAVTRTALDTHDAATAQRFWRLADAGNNNDAGYLRLGAAIALALDKPEEALTLDQQVLALAPSPDHYHAASGTALAAGEPELSLQWLAASVTAAPDNPAYRLDYALRLAGNEDRDQRLLSIPLLEQSLDDYPADFRIPETLALRYAEAEDTDLARELLRRAIDLQEPRLVVGEDDQNSLNERLFAQRRANEVLSRRNSFTLANVWSPFSVAGAIGRPLAGDNYQIALWDMALGEDPIRNGKSLSLYGRLLGTGSGTDSYFDTLGAGIGLRAKPFSQQNMNFYAELYHDSILDSALGRGADLMLRGTASFFDQGNYRNDWRPVNSRWPDRALYLDVAWFVREKEMQALARYQQGYTFKLDLPGAQTLTPYVVAQAMNQGSQYDLRAGLGLRWQFWFSDSRYEAWRGRLALRAEYLPQIGGNLFGPVDDWLVGLEFSR